MKVKYDKRADVVYINLNESKKSTKTAEASEGINVDYNGKKMIGIEILDASKRLNVGTITKLPQIIAN